MKLIDAFWEERNLGVKCVEISIAKDDEFSQVENLLSTLNSIDYIVVKVPVAKFELSHFLSQNGFVFVEGSINFHLNVKDANLSPLQQRLNNVITYSEVDEADLNQLYAEIENGLFNTDRILLDDFFTKEQAALRYINWIKDEMSRTTQVYKIQYKEDAIGFFTFKETLKDVYYPFLAGLYDRYRNSGLGFSTIRKPIEEVIKRKGRIISTYASSNNPFVVRSHIQQGFDIREIQYVYIKHNLLAKK